MGTHTTPHNTTPYTHTHQPHTTISPTYLPNIYSLIFFLSAEEFENEAEKVRENFHAVLRYLRSVKANTPPIPPPSSLAPPGLPLSTPPPPFLQNAGDIAGGILSLMRASTSAYDSELVSEKVKLFVKTIRDGLEEESELMKRTSEVQKNEMFELLKVVVKKGILLNASEGAPQQRTELIVAITQLLRFLTTTLTVG